MTIRPLRHCLAILFVTVGSTAAAGSDFLASTLDVEAIRRRLVVWPEELRPVPWLSMWGADYYINLPDIDNWSMYGELRTTWNKIRINSIPRVGHTSVVLDLHDFKFAKSNNESSSSENLSHVEWGVAADHRGNVTESEMRINLTGTPFRYDPVYTTAIGVNAHGQVACSAGNQSCRASCGGSPGSCGLGIAGRAHHALLHVVDQAAFDYAMHALLDAALDVLHRQSLSGSTTTTSSSLTNSTRGIAIFQTVSVDDTGSAGTPIVIILLLLSVAIACVVGILVGRMIRRRKAYGEFKDTTDPSPQTVGGALHSSAESDWIRAMKSDSLPVNAP